jgi:hypothetical protein
MAGVSDDRLALKNMAGMRLALNVRMQGIRPELLLGLMVLSNLCSVLGLVVVVTAILNGSHMKNSLHYTGAAIDFVTDLTTERGVFVQELRDRLGLIYDVIDEKDHIHIEYQPHHGAVT